MHFATPALGLALEAVGYEEHNWEMAFRNAQREGEGRILSGILLSIPGQNVREESVGANSSKSKARRQSCGHELLLCISGFLTARDVRGRALIP